MGLQHLDTVLAFVIVMLVLSMLITAFVQVVASLLGLRGHNLRWGVTELLRGIAPNLKPSDASTLARQLLGDPLLSVSTNWLNKLFSRWVAGPGKLGRFFNDGKRPPRSLSREEFVLVVERLVRDHAVTEAAKELASLLPTAANTYGRLQTELDRWFDVVMHAVNERFTLRARWITTVGAVLLVFGFQVNAVEIYRRLRQDPVLSAKIAATASRVDSSYQQLNGNAAPSPSSTQNTPQDSARVARSIALLRDIKSQVDSSDVVALRWVAADVFATHGLVAWWSAATKAWGGSFGADLATVLLLSLGAPFWYRMMRDVVGFRSASAKAEDKDEHDGSST